MRYSIKKAVRISKRKRKLKKLARGKGKRNIIFVKKEKKN